jgi:hypothetical protein
MNTNRRYQLSTDFGPLSSASFIGRSNVCDDSCGTNTGDNSNSKCGYFREMLPLAGICLGGRQAKAAIAGLVALLNLKTLSELGLSHGGSGQIGFWRSAPARFRSHLPLSKLDISQG